MTPDEYRDLLTPTVDTARRAVRSTGQSIRQPGGTSPLAPSAPPALESQPISITGAGTFDLVPGYPGQAIHVYELYVFSAVTQDFELWDGATSLTGGPLVAYPANTPLFFLNVGEPHQKCTAGNALRLTTSSAGQTSGFVLYRRV